MENYGICTGGNRVGYVDTIGTKDHFTTEGKGLHRATKHGRGWFSAPIKEAALEKGNLDCA